MNIMKAMETIDLEALMEKTAAEGNGRTVVWQDSESIAFLSSGRKRRMDFHVDPSDEVTLVLKGEQRLHCLTGDGEEKVVTMGPGQMTLCPGGVPHSPRVDEGTWFLVFERVRKPGEQDRFMWFCENCGKKVYEVDVTVGNYSDDPVGQVHRDFYGDEELRTCRDCGSIVPMPE